MQTALSNLESIALAEISRVSLLDRVDTKYLMNRLQLSEFLQTLHDNYFVVEIESQRLLPYKTIYFDTADLYFYRRHHNGVLNRFKFRSREYVHTGVVFNEVKRKKNSGKTFKSRIQRDLIDTGFDAVFSDFAQTKCDGVPGDMVPQLTVKYNRITLVDKALSERLTIDINLAFNHHEASSSYENLAIVEHKCEKGTRDSIAQKELKRLRCFPTGFSKYCIGVATTHSNIKTNNFNDKIRRVEKLCAV